MMKVLLIEDELPAANRLKTLIKQYDESIQIEGLLDSNESILQWFGQHPEPDLIFSDIELLDGPVFYALEQLNLNSPIIFTTAYDQYALAAFQTNGISYLLKPFELEQLKMAMDKFGGLRKSFQLGHHQQLISTLKKMHGHHSTHYKSRLTIKLPHGIYLLKVEDITCIGTKHGVVYAFKGDGKKLPLSEKIGDLQALLHPATFFRINRSEIINVNFIEKVEPYFNDRLAVTVKGQKEVLIISAAKTPDFRRWLNQL